MGETTFDEVFRDEYARLLRVARLIVRDDGRAREVVQESFARALVRWHRVGRYESPASWLLTVTVRQAVRVRDRSFREVGPGERDRVSPQRGPAAAVEARVLVQAGLAELSPQQRAVVVLHHLEDLPVDEVARRLGVSTGTVKTQLHRGRARLAAVLADQSNQAATEEVDR